MADSFGSYERPEGAYIVVYRSERADGSEYEHIWGPYTKRGAKSKLSYEAKYRIKSDFHIEKMTGTWERVE